MEQDQSRWKTCFCRKSGISTFTTRKRRKTLEQLSFTELLRLLSSAVTFLTFFCLDPNIQPPHSLVSSRLIHLPQCSFPLPALLLLFLPPRRLSFSWFLLYLKIAVHLCNHSIFFHPSPPFLLSVARSAEKNKSVCVSHQITTEGKEQGRGGEGRGGDKATRADGDWKEHASVLFCDIRGYTLRESVLKMWGLILSKRRLDASVK